MFISDVKVDIFNMRVYGDRFFFGPNWWTLEELQLLSLCAWSKHNVDFGLDA